MRTPIAAIIAATCALAGLVGCGAKAATDGASGQASTAGSTAPAIAGPGQNAPGSAVPWAQVGPGWALLEWNASVEVGSKSTPAPTILFLTDPLGGRYTLFTWPANGPAPGGLLIDWSGDKRRALFWEPGRGACSPLRWWDATTVLASCAAGGPGDDGNSQMWLIPASGKAPAALTPLRTQGGASPDWGDDNYVRLASGDYVEAMGNHCGNHVIARLEPHGTVAVVKVPGATEATIEAATATRLLLLIHPGGCGAEPSPQSLIWLDPKTGARTTVIPTAKGQFGVMGVVPYYDVGQH